MPDRQWGPEEYAAVAWALGAIALLAGICAVALAKFRGVADDSGNDAGESLIKFREMHSRGVLSDEEFRTIKANLAQSLRRQLKDSEEPG